MSDETTTSEKNARSRIVTPVVIALLALAAFVYRAELIAWFGGHPGAEPSTAGAGGSDARSGAGRSAAETIEFYTCVMHPSVRKGGPGRCPICGMPLVPVKNGEKAVNLVTIPPARRQLIGVRTSQVIEAKMVQPLRAIGRLAYDESKLSDVSLKVRGWIVSLRVTTTGQRVQKGQTLFTLYSPELYNAQQDFLLAVHGQSGASSHGVALAQAARQRLRLLDLSDAQIEQVAASGKPLENVAFSAPESGFVIEKNVVEGAAVEPGMRLYRIASLDKIWIEADVYEADFARVRVGQKASVTLDYMPGSKYQARVAYVYPYLNPETRTGRVRLELVNRKLELRPGMYANVFLEADLGSRLQVPASAVVYTGPRRLVFVDMGEGRFRPQEVTIGAEADGMYEVLSGLAPGDVVASSGVFLISAEARISTASKYWDSSEAGEIGASDKALAPMPEREPRAAPARSASANGSKKRPSVPSASPAPPHVHAPSEANATIYTCPMHSQVRSPTPGKCPICGMTLVPVAPSEAR